MNEEKIINLLRKELDKHVMLLNWQLEHFHLILPNAVI